jgi:hypothetical protein
MHILPSTSGGGAGGYCVGGGAGGYVGAVTATAAKGPNTNSCEGIDDDNSDCTAIVDGMGLMHIITIHVLLMQGLSLVIATHPAAGHLASLHSCREQASHT